MDGGSRGVAGTWSCFKKDSNGAATSVSGRPRRVLRRRCGTRESEDRWRERPGVLVAEVLDLEAMALREPGGDQRAVAGGGRGLDAEQRGTTVDRQLAQEIVDAHDIEDAGRVGGDVLGRQRLAGALADPLPRVGRILELAHLGGRRELGVMDVADSVLGEPALQPLRV